MRTVIKDAYIVFRLKRPGKENYVLFPFAHGANKNCYKLIKIYIGLNMLQYMHVIHVSLYLFYKISIKKN